jgi:Flp pilus assembly protein TadG
MKSFLKNMRTRRSRIIRHRRSGQAFIEFALIVVFFLMVFVWGTLQFSVLFNASNQLSSIVREGGRFAAKHGAQSQVKYNGSFIETDTAIRNYIRDVTDDTKLIDKAHIPNANIDISPASGTAQRASGNPITITVRYDLRNKLFSFMQNVRFIPGVSNIGVQETTVTMIIE